MLLQRQIIGSIKNMTIENTNHKSLFKIFTKIELNLDFSKHNNYVLIVTFLYPCYVPIVSENV